MKNLVLGIDVGGSGIKGALVDLNKGDFVGDRVKILTPEGFQMPDVAAVVAEIAQEFNYKGPIGVGFPAPVRPTDGVCLVAPTAHHYPGWKGNSISDAFASVTGSPVTVVNDADAAAIAEASYGVASGRDGTVILITLGTGVGSGLILNGNLVPNTELGKLYLKGQSIHAEQYMASRIREEEDLSYKAWGKRLNEYLVYIEWILRPDLIVLGGGVSRKYEKYSNYITVETEVLPAELRNKAGIVGAASATKMYQALA
ncbi:MAG: ROK family protein [Chloroflexota bacterium]